MVASKKTVEYNDESRRVRTRASNYNRDMTNKNRSRALLQDLKAIAVCMS